jgi:hypothetical protein
VPGPRACELDRPALPGQALLALDLPRRRREAGEQLFREIHHLLVVGVGPVELQHGELGVVASRDPLVPKVPVDLVDPRDAAHQEPLQEQLGGDPQVEVEVERVVVSGERLRRRPAGDAVHHRRLDLQEAPGVQKAADAADEGGPHLEHLARLGVGGEIEIALAVAGLDVGQAVPLLGQRAERLGKESEVVDGERQLPQPGADERTGGAQEVAQVQVVEDELGVFGELVRADEELQLLAPVVEIGEDDLPLGADALHPAGDPERDLRRLQLLGGLLPIAGTHPTGLRVPVEAMGVGLDPPLGELLALGAPVFDLIVELRHFPGLPSSVPRPSARQAGATIAYPRGNRGRLPPPALQRPRASSAKRFSPASLHQRLKASIRVWARG